MNGMLPLIVRRVGDTDFWWHVVTAQHLVHSDPLARGVCQGARVSVGQCPGVGYGSGGGGAAAVGGGGWGAT